METIKRNGHSHRKTVKTKSSIRWWRRWPEGVHQVAIVWTLLYGVLGLYWSLGGPGYPLSSSFHVGPGNDQSAAGTMFSNVAVGAPIITILCFMGVWVLLNCKSHSRGFARKVLLFYAWSTAAILCFAIADARALIVVAYAPVCLVMALLGWPVNHYFDTITWPVVNQFICIVGGLIWAATALSFQRQSREACCYCGRKSAAARWIDSESALRWGRRITYVAIFTPAYYEVTRISWLLGIRLGITNELLHSLQDTGAVWAGAGLALVSVGGACLTHGLIKPWGENFPRWIPFLSGKRVPPALAVIPATLVSILSTVTGIQVVRGAFSHEIFHNWGATTPLLLYPVWGIALGIATIFYYFRRQGHCNNCGL